MTCPDDKTLKLFIVGNLAPQRIDEIEKHLETCPNCSQRLSELEVGTGIPLFQGIKAAQLSGSGSVGGDHSIDGVIPQTIGHYKVCDLLGAGGMGTVYLAENPHLDRRVAIKVVKASRRIHQASVDRFVREMKAAGQLQHPNIVQSHDGGVIGDTVDGQPFLVMEYLEGSDLAQHVKDHGPFSVEKACDIIRQVASALDYAHRLGFVHRDIKPSNLWITPDGTVKILDFGLVNILETKTAETSTATPLHETALSSILGSPDYISPEQIVDSKKADNRSDIYSLGCTFFFLLTGRPPFDKATHPNLDAKLEAHASQDLPPLRQFRNDIPVAVEAVLRRMTAKRPEERYQNAEAVLKAIANLKPTRTKWIIGAIASIFLILAGAYLFLPKSPSPVASIAKPSVEPTIPDIAIEEQQPEPSIISTISDTQSSDIDSGEQASIVSESVPSIQEVISAPVTSPITEQTSDKETPIPKFIRVHQEDHNWGVTRTFDVRPGIFNSAYFVSDETIIEADDQKTIRIWSIATGKVLQTFETKRASITCFAVASDGSLFATGHKNGAVELWDLNAGQSIHSYRKRDGAIRTLCFSNDSKKLFSLSNEFDIVDIETKKSDITEPAIRQGEVFYPCGSSFDPDDDFVFFSVKNTVGMYLISENELKGFDESIPCKPPIVTVKIRDSLAIASGKSQAWLTTGMKLGFFQSVFSFASDVTKTPLDQVTGEVDCLAFRPYRKHLLVGGKDMPVNLLDYAEPPDWDWTQPAFRLEQAFPLENANDAVIALDCSPDGRKFLLRTKNNPQIVIWEFIGEFDPKDETVEEPSKDKPFFEPKDIRNLRRLRGQLL